MKKITKSYTCVVMKQPYAFIYRRFFQKLTGSYQAIVAGIKRSASRLCGGSSRHKLFLLSAHSSRSIKSRHYLYGLGSGKNRKHHVKKNFRSMKKNRTQTPRVSDGDTRPDTQNVAKDQRKPDLVINQKKEKVSKDRSADTDTLEDYKDAKSS
jgi:hypothetical protein